MKWEPIAAMALLILLGVWLVYPSTHHDLRPGAQLSKIVFGGSKGELETVLEPSGERTFRLLFRADDRAAAKSGAAGPRLSERVLTQAEFIELFGQARYDSAVASSGNKLFRMLNISSWASLVWVGVGFAGQGAFFGRMFIQWLVSERRKDSVIPQSFWWLSLFGGVTLFVYFAWRQDLIALLGQTSGVVIYARNIRLIHKRRRREERAGEA